MVRIPGLRRLNYWYSEGVSDSPLKPFRSEAERIALRQRNIQIGLTAVNLALVGAVAMRTFGLL